jgi:hypothetical protein
MDFDKIISATGDQEGILINVILSEKDGVAKVESKRYSPDEPNFALAVQALDYFVSRNDHV